MKPGILVYKCRRCGETSKKTHVPDCLTAITCIHISANLPSSWGCLLPKITEICQCKDGNYGIADLIGSEIDGNGSA